MVSQASYEHGGAVDLGISQYSNWGLRPIARGYYDEGTCVVKCSRVHAGHMLVTCWSHAHCFLPPCVAHDEIHSLHS